MSGRQSTLELFRLYDLFINVYASNVVLGFNALEG